MRPALRFVVVVASVGLLGILLPARATNDPGWGNQWNMRIVGVETAWATGTGKGTTIAIVDSGVHLSQEDLAGKLLPGRDFVDEGTSPQDDNGHGTHVAGIAAAFANNGRGVVGVAPDARVLPVKVLDADGRGASDIDEGIRWAVDNGAQVINLSIGDLLEPLNGPPFVEAIRHAWTRGVICVVATGNEFVTSSTFDDEPAIVVTATDRNDRIATYATAVGNAKWGMAAPGGAGGINPENDVYSTYWTSANAANRYEWLAGTSMAAPHVAGAAAVLRSLGLTPQQTVDRLLATAKDLGDPGKDGLYGSGRLDLAKAVSGLAPGSGSGSGGASTTTTTTQRTSGSAATTTAADAGASRRAATSNGSAPSASGSPGSAQQSTDTNGELSPNGSDSGVPVEQFGEGEEAATPEGGSNGGGPVWPVGIPAAAALAAVAGAAARARRRRV